MSELERALGTIGGELDYPPTPALAARFGPAWPRRPRPRRALRPREAIALAFAVLLIGAGSAFAASPGLRHSVLDWLGLRSVKIERAPRCRPPPAGTELSLGDATTLAGARAWRRSPRAGAGAAPGPGVLRGQPAGRPGGARLPAAPACRPRAGRGMLITEFRGQQPITFLQKTLGPGTTASA